MTEEYKKSKSDCLIYVRHELRNASGAEPLEHMMSIQSIADEAAAVAEAPIDKDMAINAAARCFQRLLIDGSIPEFYEVENCYLDKAFADQVKHELVRVGTWAKRLAREILDGPEKEQA